MGQYKKAENDYTEAIVLNPEGAKAYYNRGLLYKETDQNEKAIADFERFLEIAHDPNWCREAEGCLRELRGE